MKHKALSKDICLLEKKSETIEYELYSYICPICKKEIICLTIEGKIVHGGEGSYGKKEGCHSCILNETAELLKESVDGKDTRFKN